jgi:glutamine---fructose-6-phosphate transaminase (isomerizing)
MADHLNVPGSPVTEGAALTVMLAGEEKGGVACRTFQHPLALLLALNAHLTGSPAVAGLARRAADATSDLLDRREERLPRALELLDGQSGVRVIAPAERISSAEIRRRDGVRRAADLVERAAR